MILGSVRVLLDFNARRKALKMPVEVLVKRSGVPRPTVFRILGGNVDSARFGNVQKVAGVLGLSLEGNPIDPALGVTS